MSRSPRNSVSGVRGSTTHRSRAPTSGCVWHWPPSATHIASGSGPACSSRRCATRWSMPARPRHSSASPRAGSRSRFGTGYTGRRAMGQRPISWAYMTRYITTFRALLRGETVEWEGGALRMLHPPESRPAATDSIPIHIGAIGPKGVEAARSLADGLFVVGGVPEGAGEFANISLLTYGSVLGDHEPLDSERLRTAAGPGLVQAFHISYETGGADAVTALPGGAAWLDGCRGHTATATSPRGAHRTPPASERGRHRGMERGCARDAEAGHPHRHC